MIPPSPIFWQPLPLSFAAPAIVGAPTRSPRLTGSSFKASP